MQISKIINNNVVSGKDQQGKEVVIMGKGIGFQKKPMDKVEESLIEKVFSLPKEHTSEFEKLIEDIPYEHIRAAEAVIRYASGVLGKKLNKNIYITLTDHMNFALERQKKGIAVSNALLWEIQKFYRLEYQIGCKAIEIVREQLGVELSKEEAGFFALHIVNAEMDGSDMEQASAVPEIIKDIINIVRYSHRVEMDETSIAYERFITHLKFFIQRVISGAKYSKADPEIYEMFQRKYKDAFACALKIKKYIAQKMDYEVPEEEIIYLTAHIAKITEK